MSNLPVLWRPQVDHVYCPSNCGIIGGVNRHGRVGVDRTIPPANHSKEKLTMATSDSTPLKRCSKCKREFPATNAYYSRKKDTPDKLTRSCHECRGRKKPNGELSTYALQKLVPEGFKRCSRGDDCEHANGPILPATNEYFQKHPNCVCGLKNVCKACESHYVRENKEHINRAARAWRAKNRARYNKETREQRNTNSKHVNELRRLRLRRNPERVRVVQRNRYARQMGAEGHHTAQDIEILYKAQKGRCYWCDKRVGKDYHVDHVIPLSRGGTNWPSNLVIACAYCNCSRGNKLPHEWGSKLL